jgi:hypothetical protein
VAQWDMPEEDMEHLEGLSSEEFLRRLESNSRREGARIKYEADMKVGALLDGAVTKGVGVACVSEGMGCGGQAGGRLRGCHGGIWVCLMKGVGAGE